VSQRASTLLRMKGDTERRSLVIKVEPVLRRSWTVGVETIILKPRLGDFNDDLRHIGAGALRARHIGQIARCDVA